MPLDLLTSKLFKVSVSEVARFSFVILVKADSTQCDESKLLVDAAWANIEFSRICNFLFFSALAMNQVAVSNFFKLDT